MTLFLIGHGAAKPYLFRFKLTDKKIFKCDVDSKYTRPSFIVIVHLSPLDRYIYKLASNHF